MVDPFLATESFTKPLELRKDITKIMRIPIPRIITDNRLLVFNSFPDFADNSYALYLFLEENNYWEKYKFIWLVSEVTDELKEKVESNGFHCSLVKKKSFKGVLAFLRCRHFLQPMADFKGLKQNTIRIDTLISGMGCHLKE